MEKLLKIKFFKNFVAFTLAETLIVMGIIGIVSALTLPNLNSSTGEKEKVAKVKKMYQNLTDAFERSQVVYGPIDDVIAEKDLTPSNVSDLSKVFGERLIEFMKISKNCETDFSKGCFASSSDGDEDDLKSYSFILADGSSVMLAPAWGVGLAILIDIDGPNKGPSETYKDLFIFYLDPNTNYSELKPLGEAENCKTLENNGLAGCTAWVIQNGNMDYLKTDSSGKCPNGKILDGTTNITCK